MSARARFRDSHGRRQPSRLGWCIAVMLAAAACSNEAPQSPPAVHSVDVSPSRSTLDVGETARFRATVEDDAGNVLTDRGVRWSTDIPYVAMVSQRGEVTAVGAGVATITASVDGKRGSARVTVESRKVAMTISAISPDPLVEGETAVITGQGFDPVAANNKVTLDGTPTSVTEASTTRLTMKVPAADCRPARTVQLRLTTGNDLQGVTVSRSLRPAAVVNAPLGRQVILRDPTNFCLQFAPASTAEAYLIGVQSTIESPKALTGVKIDAVSAAGAGAAPALAPEYAAVRQSLPMSAHDGRDDAITRAHHAAEVQLREQDRKLFERLRQSDRSLMRQAAGAAAAPSFPPNLKAGDVITMRMPSWGNLCQGFTPIRAAVRYVGTRVIWLEDVANPPGGYGPAEVQTLSRLVDEKIYDGNVEYFGVPTDVDRNGRFAIVITQEVNRIKLGEASYLLGFVATADMVPQSVCPAANEGEVFYGRTPDAAGAVGAPLGLADMMTRAPRNIAHEMAHIIQLGRRLYANTPQIVFPDIWQVEGQASLAEEVMGFRVEGRQPGRNYGGDIVTPPAGAMRWYGAIVDILGLYFGWQPNGPRVANAPEQCTWLVLSPENGPCYASELLPYGEGWLFFRWLSDHFGPKFPGGERGLHKAIVDNNAAGFPAIAKLVGVPSDSMLAQFAAMQYVDDRVPEAEPRLTLPTWNLPSILSRSVVDQQIVPRERAFGSFSDAVSVRGVSTAYFRISGAQRAGTAIRVRGADGNALPAHMRLWVVRVK